MTFSVHYFLKKIVQTSTVLPAASQNIITIIDCMINCKRKNDRNITLLLHFSIRRINESEIYEYVLELKTTRILNNEHYFVFPDTTFCCK